MRQRGDDEDALHGSPFVASERRVIRESSVDDALRPRADVREIAAQRERARHFDVARRAAREAQIGFDVNVDERAVRLHEVPHNFRQASCAGKSRNRNYEANEVKRYKQ